MTTATRTASPPTFPRTALRGATLCALLACGLAGCRMPHAAHLTKSGTPQYERMDVVYDVSGHAGAVASQCLRDIRPVSHAEGETVECPGWQSAHLRIQYPHPEGRTGQARATLRLSRSARLDQSAETSFRDRMQERLRKLSAPEYDAEEPLPEQLTANDELWILDLPKEQVDLLLADLANSGFFADQSRPFGVARLSVRTDGARTFKDWDTEPRLDDLMTRIYREGWLGSFIAAAE